MYVLLLFVVVVLTRSQKIVPRSRIVGGYGIPIEKVPYQAALQVEGTLTCGASIISSTYLITAAHCTHGENLQALSVRAGTSTRQIGGQQIAVRDVTEHPQYNPNTFNYDIAIVTLSAPLDFGFGVDAIALPTQGETWPPGTEVLVTGWGLLHQSDSELPDILYAVSVNIIELDVCKKMYGGGLVMDQMICAGVDGGGKDSCSSDSGGPLQADGVLVGVVSWGAGCALNGFPGVYTNVSATRNFIKQITGI